MASHLAPTDPSGTTFLDLPREMRDMIYDQVHIHKARLNGSLPPTGDAIGYTRVRVRDAPNPSVLRLSRQIKEEYISSLKNKSALVVSQRPETTRKLDNYRPFQFPTQCQYISYAEFHLGITNTHFDWPISGPRIVEASVYEKWIRFAVGILRCLKSIEITLYIPKEVCDSRRYNSVQKFSQSLLLFPRVTKVTSYLHVVNFFDWDNIEKDWNFTNQKRRLHETNAEGKVVLVEDTLVEYTAPVKRDLALWEDEDEYLGFE